LDPAVACYIQLKGVVQCFQGDTGVAFRPSQCESAVELQP